MSDALRSGPPRCQTCGERAPYGDERLVWLGWHEGWVHRSWWFVKRLLGRSS